VDDPLSLGALSVDVAEPHLDAADHRILDVVEKPGWSGLGLAGAPASRVDDGRCRRGSACSRNGSGSARTSLLSAASTAGVAVEAGPATRNKARASFADSPDRSVRAPPTSRQPPPRPCTEYTGTPAMDSASRSRRAVRSETSKSRAASDAVTCSRCCSRGTRATSRSARIRPHFHIKQAIR